MYLFVSSYLGGSSKVVEFYDGHISTGSGRVKKFFESYTSVFKSPLLGVRVGLKGLVKVMLLPSSVFVFISLYTAYFFNFCPKYK
jgi:hypothetical protein